jgi:hypothetical protein
MTHNLIIVAGLVCLAYVISGSGMWKAFSEGYRGTEPQAPYKCDPKKKLILELSDENFSKVKDGGKFVLEFSTDAAPTDWNAELKELTRKQ